MVMKMFMLPPRNGYPPRPRVSRWLLEWFMACVFCDIDQDRIEWEDDLVFAIRDAYPVTAGHTLLIPKRHVATWFDATETEQVALVRGVKAMKSALDASHAPDAYNVGINAGAAAGQTVMHLHVHLIPRRTGDVADPRGGVRHVIAGKGNYLRRDDG